MGIRKKKKKKKQAREKQEAAVPCCKKHHDLDGPSGLYFTYSDMFGSAKGTRKGQEEKNKVSRDQNKDALRCFG